jgi:Uroporphyrinogen decarboxylase (URO-D)
MTENSTPRQMLKGLLQGIPQTRPLFLPIVFSLGAKVENLPLREFLGNATKISNSLRQIRSHLRSDGVACYFDPYLEVEALGAVLQWQTGDQPPAIQWPQSAEKGEVPDGLRSPEDAAKSSRVTVAVEAIRRLKSLLRDERLLMAGVAGPFTLAARITGLRKEDAARREDFPDAALELAAATITEIASKFVEAGANVIFIQENIVPKLSVEDCEAWASLLAPAINIVRFYEALPVLEILDSHLFAENDQVIRRQNWDCILCPTLAASAFTASEMITSSEFANRGIALSLEALQPEASAAEKFLELLHAFILKSRPAIVTTAGDVPGTTDVKFLARVWEAVRS